MLAEIDFTKIKYEKQEKTNFTLCDILFNTKWTAIRVKLKLNISDRSKNIVIMRYNTEAKYIKWLKQLLEQSFCLLLVNNITEAFLFFQHNRM